MSDNKPEVEVSDIANEVQEPVTISVSDLLSQVSGGDLNQANKTFAELIGDRVNDALEAEKVKVAGEIYNDQERDDDVSEEDVEAALAELDAEDADAEDADGTGADEVVDEVEDGAEDDGTEAEASSVESEESPEAEEVVEPADEVESEAVSADSGSDSFDLGTEEEHAELEDPFEAAGQEVDEILASEDEEVVPSEE
jgi:hypothetical protein